MASRIKTAGGSFMVLFGLPFLLGGLGVGIFYWGMLADWYRAQTWVEVPCMLENSELRDHMERSSSGSTRDTLMNEAEAMYRYTYAGREYQGHRVSLSFGADNFGDYQERVAAVMQEARNAGGSFRCYVNPVQPHESLLFRQARWTLLLFMSVFPLLFPLAGGLVSFAGFRNGRTREKHHALQSRYPDEPWRWKPEREGDWMLPENRPVPVVMTVITGWVALVWGPMLFALSVDSDVTPDNPVSLLGLLPALPLCLLVLLTLRSWARHARPVPQVHMQPQPALTGGPLRVQVALPQAADMSLRALTDHHLLAQLTCSSRWVDHSGEDSTSRQEQVWTDEKRVPLISAVREASGSRIEVKFDLPRKVPAPDLPQLGNLEADGPDWVWILELHAPGWQQSWLYEIPVYAGKTTARDESDDDGKPDSAKDAGLGDIKHKFQALDTLLELDADEVEMHLRKSGMSMQRDHRGRPELFDMPPARFAPGRTVLTCITGTLFLVVLLLLFLQVPWVVQFVFGLFLLITGLITFTLYTARQVRVEPEALEISWRGGPWRKIQQLPRQEIRSFESSQNMHVGNATYYQVSARTQTGRKIVLLDGLPGKPVAQGIITILEHWHRQQAST